MKAIETVFVNLLVREEDDELIIFEQDVKVVNFGDITYDVLAHHRIGCAEYDGDDALYYLDVYDNGDGEFLGVINCWECEDEHDDWC